MAHWVCLLWLSSPFLFPYESCFQKPTVTTRVSRGLWKHVSATWLRFSPRVAFIYYRPACSHNENLILTVRDSCCVWTPVQLFRLIKPFQLWDLNEILLMRPCLLVDGGRQITPSMVHVIKWSLKASQILWITYIMKIVEPLFVINVELFCVHQQIELKDILKHSVLRPVSHQNTTACCAASWRGRVRGYARSAINRDAEKTFIERIKHQGKLHAGSCSSAGRTDAPTTSRQTVRQWGACQLTAGFTCLTCVRKSS